MIHLCQEYTNLSEDDINELVRTANRIESSSLYAQNDVFIDVFNELTQEALVVYHRPPESGFSLYKQIVTGKDALLKNEPGVLRTLETGLNTVGLTAISQEYQLIKQSIYPIRNNRQTIGVTIIEEDLSKEIVTEMDNSGKIKDYQRVTSVLKAIFHYDEAFFNQLSDAILAFNPEGKLILTNRVASELYEKIGYLDSLMGMDYDNLMLDYSTFEYVLYQIKTQGNDLPVEHDVKYLDNYFDIKKTWIEHEQVLVVIIQNNTQMKSQEAEIISKSVAIQEIHHRVKNNLQSIVSLLRIQQRRTESSEAKKVLRESVSRIMAIAATHELLSKQVEDEAQLKQILDSVVHNFNSLFDNSSGITIQLDVDPNIRVNSEQMVTISLIINELIQNVFDHAFDSGQRGEITIKGWSEGKLIYLSVEDNGKGYDVKQANSSSLGLMIVHGYVKDKLKGKIKIESNKQGTKTCFHFERNNIDVVKR